MNKVWQNMQFCQIRQTLATPDFCHLRYNALCWGFYIVLLCRAFAN